MNADERGFRERRGGQELRVGGDVALLLTALGLPLVGALAAGRDLRPLAEYPPPLEIPTDYVRFHWGAAGVVLGLLVVLIGAWILAARVRGAPRAVSSGRPARTLAMGRFPRWGWVALVWTLAWWVLAWTRFPWFEDLQRFTFFPLWLGLIVTVNALTQARRGTCWLRRDPGRWLALFGVSALFWWVFEWLNRFVLNWHYLGVQDFGPVAYALHASVCFSTVLPAVAAFAEWLQTHEAWCRRLTAGPVARWLSRREVALGWLVAGLLALLGTGVWPRLFYPALWAAPLALMLGRSILAGNGGAVREAAAGDWTRPISWMAAALICGFFWELWNWHSLAKWVYTVPGVDGWRVFEMPLLGYTGYLPFGLECLLAVERVFGPAKAEGLRS